MIFEGVLMLSDTGLHATIYQMRTKIALPQRISQ